MVLIISWKHPHLQIIIAKSSNTHIFHRVYLTTSSLQVLTCEFKVFQASLLFPLWRTRMKWGSGMVLACKHFFNNCRWLHESHSLEMSYVIIVCEAISICFQTFPADWTGIVLRSYDSSRITDVLNFLNPAERYPTSRTAHIRSNRVFWRSMTSGTCISATPVGKDETHLDSLTR